MTDCSLSEHQKDLLRAVVSGLKLQEAASIWWIQITHDTALPRWQGVADDALRAELQARTTLADVDAFERCGLLSNPEAGRYELFAQRAIDLVEGEFGAFGAR